MPIIYAHNADNQQTPADMSNQHLPDFSSWHRMEILLAVGNMLELQKILDPRAYAVGKEDQWTDLAEKEFLLARNWFTLAKHYISTKYIAMLDGELMDWKDIWNTSKSITTLN